MIKTGEIYWLAGLLEGEGYFCISIKANKCPQYTLGVSMTDSDIVSKASLILLGKRRITSFANSVGCKEVYEARVHGDLAIQWMMTLYSLFGKRRQKKIKEIITHWKSYKDKFRFCRKMGHPLIGSNIRLDKNGYKNCLTCKNIRRREIAKQKKENKLCELTT